MEKKPTEKPTRKEAKRVEIEKIKSSRLKKISRNLKIDKSC